MPRHYHAIKRFWTPNRESYTGLGQLYQDNPDFRAFYAPFGDGFVEFLATAMAAYAEKNLE